jgi:hypothetical protein
MMKIDEWLIELISKRQKELAVFFRYVPILLMVVYSSFFVKFGIEFVEYTTYSLSKTILWALGGTLLAIIVFFIMHFSGGIHFQLTLIIVFVGFALAGTACGLIIGLLTGFIGWLIGVSSGAFIAFLTIRLYQQTEKKGKKIDRESCEGQT